LLQAIGIDFVFNFVVPFWHGPVVHLFQKYLLYRMVFVFELVALNGESATNLAYPLRSSARTAAPAVLGPCELFLLFNTLVA
jgi:hypothetical protein